MQHNSNFNKPDERIRHVIVKHGCPWQQLSQNMSKISKSYILFLPKTQGHGM